MYWCGGVPKEHIHTCWVCNKALLVRCCAYAKTTAADDQNICCACLAAVPLDVAERRGRESEEED